MKRLDYRHAPPLEIDPDKHVTVDPDVRVCNFCHAPVPVISHVEYDTCSSCLEDLPAVDGMTITKVATAPPEDIRGYGDPHDPESWFKFARNVRNHGMPLGEQLGQFGQSRTTYTPAMGSQDELKRAKPVPASRFYEEKVTRNWSRTPTIDDPPGVIYQYIHDNYSAQDIEERYSEIRNELLYPPKAIKVVISDEQNPETATRISGGGGGTSFGGGSGGSAGSHYASSGYHVHISAGGGGGGGSHAGEQSYLTGLKPSATIEDEDATQPESSEETDVARGFEAILSEEEAQAAFKKAAAALSRIESLKAKYSPDLPNGSVIAFKIQFPGTGERSAYSYAAIKAAGQWFLTGKLHPDFEAGVGMSWTDILSVCEKFICTDFEVLRQGGDAAELPAGVDHREVIIPEDKLDAFDSEPKNSDMTPQATIVSDSYDR